jgi:mono/diheme cytochrome c family protein
LEKAARTLLQRAPSESELAGLLDLPPPEAVDRMMQSPRFVETVLDFNLYYLGFKHDSSVRSRRDWQEHAIIHPSALVSALEFAKGGNYLRLWEYSQPMPLEPLERASLPKEENEPGEEEEDPEASEANDVEETNSARRREESLAQHEIRQIIYATIVAGLDAEIAKLTAPNYSAQLACASLGLGSNVRLDDAGAPSGLSSALVDVVFLPPAIDCFINGATDPVALSARMIELRERMPRIIDLMESIARENYKLDSLTDIRLFDLPALGLGDANAYTQEGVWFNLQNSSTNMNRRRGAYVLKRYFCDDLTPVNVALPEQHGSEEHAASPSCASCHYKLDPMAGFFMDHGLIGINFSQSSTIVFDDLVRMPREQYSTRWQHPDGDGWNVGYIRSLTDRSKNEYGGGIEAMFQIIRGAPEAKQCLVKRMLQYFVDEDQVFDADYMSELTREFSELAQTNSSEAFRRAVQRMVTSQTFAQRDPVSQKCYDFVAGTKPENRPPCAVAALMARNCTSCHGPNAGAGGLNLENWVALNNGEQSFPHVRDGRQLSKQETMAAIVERLSSTDPNLRMPLQQTIKDVERDVIFHWANQQMMGHQPTQGE